VRLLALSLTPLDGDTNVLSNVQAGISGGVESPRWLAAGLAILMSKLVPPIRCSWAVAYPT